MFGSWTYDSTKVVVKCERDTALFDDPNSFYESAEWKINGIPCREASMPVPGSPHLNYSLAVFTFQVETCLFGKKSLGKSSTNNLLYLPTKALSLAEKVQPLQNVSY